MRRLSIASARQTLTSLPEQLENEEEAVAITRRGEPVLAVMSWELYEGLVETLDILTDEEMVSLLRRSITELDEGRVVGWNEAKERFDL